MKPGNQKVNEPKGLLRTESARRYRFLLYTVNVTILLITVAIVQLQRQNHNVSTDKMSRFHLVTIASVAKARDQMHILQSITQTRESEFRTSQPNNTNTVSGTNSDTRLALYLVQSEIAKITQAQNEFRDPEFEELVNKTMAQFSNIETHVMEEVDTQFLGIDTQRTIQALELSLEQLDRLHQLKHGEQVRILPLRNRQQFQILIFIVLSFLVISLVSTQRILNMSEQASREREESDERTRLLLNSTGEAIYGLDLNGNCTFCNSACLRLLRYTREEDLLGKNMHDLIHHSYADGTPYPMRDSHILQTFQTKQASHVDNEVLWRSDGTSFDSEYWSYPMFHDGEIVGSVVTFLDITERKRVAQQLHTSLQEKEILLKEIHHRVKNNLQIISSLLNLQSAKIQDEEVQGMFMESQSRVTAMALIHEKLYRSDDLAGIDFAEYLQSLVDSLAETYISPTQAVQINVTVENIFLEIDTAIPCALIVNELVSNALKHAFPPETIPREDQNHIHVEMTRGDNDEITLNVSDNGRGFPDNLDFKNSDSLGLQIVDTLTNQLDGTIELNNNSGAIFTARFTEIKQETVVGIS